MPIAVIGIAIILFVVFAALCLSEREYHIASVLVVMAIALAAWIILAYGQTPETLSDEVFSTQTIDHSDGSSLTIMIVEGQVVNLTKEMGLSVPPDTKIRRVITSEWAGGIWWMNGKHSISSTDPDGIRQGLVSYSIAQDK